MNKIIATFLLTTLGYASDIASSDGELPMMRVYVQKDNNISPLEIRTSSDGYVVLLPDSRRPFFSEVSTGFDQFDTPKKNLCPNKPLSLNFQGEKTYYIVCFMDKNGNITFLRTKYFNIYAYQEISFYLGQPDQPNTIKCKDRCLVQRSTSI